MAARAKQRAASGCEKFSMILFFFAATTAWAQRAGVENFQR